MWDLLESLLMLAYLVFVTISLLIGLIVETIVQGIKYLYITIRDLILCRKQTTCKSSNASPVNLKPRQEVEMKPSRNNN